jgi:superfamily I DNA/RNA helicase
LVGIDGLFAVFVDPHQTTRRERAGLEWSQPESTLAGDIVTLNRNFRNGDRIIDAVEQRFRIGYDLPPRGPISAELLLMPYSNTDPMVDVVVRHETELRAAGLDPVVLISGVSEQQVAELEAAGITVSSVDAFKGLERRSVILVLARDVSPIDPHDEDLYVGMTRATVLLSLVFHTSQAPLTPHRA